MVADENHLGFPKDGRRHVEGTLYCAARAVSANDNPPFRGRGSPGGLGANMSRYITG